MNAYAMFCGCMKYCSRLTADETPDSLGARSAGCAKPLLFPETIAIHSIGFGQEFHSEISSFEQFWPGTSFTASATSLSNDLEEHSYSSQARPSSTDPRMSLPMSARIRVSSLLTVSMTSWSPVRKRLRPLRQCVSAAMRSGRRQRRSPWIKSSKPPSGRRKLSKLRSRSISRAIPIRPALTAS